MSVYETTILCICASNAKIRHTKTTTEADGKTWGHEFVRHPMATACSKSQLQRIITNGSERENVSRALVFAPSIGSKVSNFVSHCGVAE